MTSFSELPLSAELLSAIETLGYTTPSPIQAATLPLLLDAPTDFLGLAATGTGKTAAFSIPMLEKIDAQDKNIQALVLCPTRELAQQVSGQISLLGQNKKIKTATIYGGGSYNDQFYALKNGATVVVATPGRLVDHIKRGTIKLDQLKMVILDEADEMISMGFKDDLDDILQGVDKSKTQTWMFSATMSKEVRRVADDHLTNPKMIQINKTEMLSSTVEQIYYFTKEGNKPEVLTRIIDMAPAFYGIVFCQTKLLVQDVTQLLLEQGYKADCLHGDKDQTSRERTMKAFTSKKVNILVCTDVASRGLDVKDITHVINYSIPRELDSYVHRIGRTARSGKSGIAISFVTPSHMHLIPRIEKMTKSKMKEGTAPTRKDIGIKKISALSESFTEQANFKMAVDLLDDNWKKMIEEMSKEEIAGRFIALKFPELFPNKNLEKTDRPVTAQVRPEATSDRGFRRDDNRGPRRDFRRNDRRDDRRDERPNDRRDDRAPSAGRDGFRGENSFSGPRREFRSDDRRDERRDERTNERRESNFAPRTEPRPAAKIEGHQESPRRYRADGGVSSRSESHSGSRAASSGSSFNRRSNDSAGSRPFSSRSGGAFPKRKTDWSSNNQNSR